MSDASASDDLGRSATIDDDTVVLQRITLEQDQTLTIVRPRPGQGEVSANNVNGAGPDTATPDGEAATSVDVGVGTIPLQDRLQKMSALGRGSMGEVWLARDKGLNRRVAFKQMLAAHAGNADMTTRFFEEVQVTAQLDHPNVLPIYNLECTADGAPAYSMKLVQGRTLSDLLRQSATDFETHGGDPRERLAHQLDIFLRICDGMAYAHSKGVLHRDLKPDNVMVGRFNEVYIMDWGICRVMSQPETSSARSANDTVLVSLNESESDRTQVGAVIGTPAYLSPEQALGLNALLDARSDQYTLGLILQEIVTLKRARPSAQVRVMVRRAARAERDPVPARVGGFPVPAELRAIIDKATAARVEDRYESVSALAADIRRYLQGDAVRARPDSPVQALLRFVGRHRLGTVTSLVAAVLIGTLSVAAIQWRADEREFALELERDALNQFVMLGMRRQKEIDDRLITYRTAGSIFAGRIIQWVDAPPVQPAPLHLASAFDDAQAPGLMFSDLYGMPVSFKVPVVQVASGTPPASVAESLKTVGTLNDAFRNVMIRAAGVTPETMSEEQIETWLARGLSPVHRTSLSLANGVYVAFPGHGRYPDDYDGRQRPKYQVSDNLPGMRWGAPYQDAFGSGLLLPASIGLYDDQHRFFGVAAVDLRFDELAKPVLEAEYPSFVREVLLLDAEGKVLVRGAPASLSPVTTQSTAAAQNKPATAADDSGGMQQDPADASSELKRPVFEYFSALDVRVLRDFGAVDLEDEDRYIGYFYLHSTNWFFVVVADRKALVAHYAQRAAEKPLELRTITRPAAVDAAASG